MRDERSKFSVRVSASLPCFSSLLLGPATQSEVLLSDRGDLWPLGDCGHPCTEAFAAVHHLWQLRPQEPPPGSGVRRGGQGKERLRMVRMFRGVQHLQQRSWYDTHVKLKCPTDQRKPIPFSSRLFYTAVVCRQQRRRPLFRPPDQ